MDYNLMLAQEVQSFYAQRADQLTPEQRRVLADAVTIIRSAPSSDPARFVFGVAARTQQQI